MRSRKYLLLAMLAITALWIACSNEKTASVQMVSGLPINTSSKEAVAAFQEAMQMTDEANNKKARVAFEKAIALDSNMTMAYLYRANISQSAKDYMDDLARAKSHLEGGSEWEKIYYDFQQTFASNDWDKRLDLVQKLVAAYPNSARAQVELGYVYQTNNEAPKERTAFEKAISLDPTWIGGYNALAGSYLFSEPKDFKKAETNALKMVELAPKSAAAQILLGDVYRAQDDLEKARTAYAKAVELSPDEATGYYKEGHANSFLGKFDEARSNYIEGAKHDENNTGAMVFVAGTYLYAGDHKSAMQSLMDNAAKVDASGDSKSMKAGNKLNYLYSCAIACFHNGDIPHLREVVSMMEGPSNQVAADVGTSEEGIMQKTYSLYWLALADAWEGKLDSARAKAEQIKSLVAPVKLPSKLYDYEMAMGYINMKENKYADALIHFEKANPNSIYTKYWMAKANEAAGNKDKANALYKEIAIYNFNGTEYAVIREEARKKAL